MRFYLPWAVIAFSRLEGCHFHAAKFLTFEDRDEDFMTANNRDEVANVWHECVTRYLWTDRVI